MRVSFNEMLTVMQTCLLKYGVNEDIAKECAHNLAENSLSGVYSHGLNRFPRVIAMLKNGHIKPNNRPTCLEAFAALERWDGNLGMGNTNAIFTMNRAINLAENYGVGTVALRNTNHWQRGGAFGVQAAKAGYIGLCFSNTMPNMPAWGATDRRLGNNPLVLCLPYKDDYVMIDSAMSQFSYGALERARLEGKELPVAGGYDSHNNLSTNPAAIEETKRLLPMGFWKGSGFSILLDLLAATLAGGLAVCDIGRQGNTPTDEYNLSQIFIAIKVNDKAANDQLVSRVIADIKASLPMNATSPVLYPSERQKELYRQNSQLGIPVNKTIWENVLSL
ncbi:MAG: 3-dehydro-L-gulonate 2-dehydrogenase [Spirochaetaceae bacterium]|nr:3-dehydro-L-gulonate 2-dehydrogenase [Spirochaetaceae bacterium]